MYSWIDEIEKLKHIMISVINKWISLCPHSKISEKTTKYIHFLILIAIKLFVY